MLREIDSGVDSGLLRWMLCISRDIDSGVDSGLLRWTLCMSREKHSGVLLYKSYRLLCRPVKVSPL